MNKRTVIFGYISFLREKIDAAKAIMAKREKDYLWFCFDPSRVVQDGPATPVPNHSFSIILDTDDAETIEVTADLEASIRQLPFLACTLVIEKEGQDRNIFTWRP